MKTIKYIPEPVTPPLRMQNHTNLNFAENIIKKYQQLNIVAFCNDYALAIKNGRAYYFIASNGTIHVNQLAVVIESSHKAGEWFFNAFNTLGYQLSITQHRDVLSYDYNKASTYHLN